MISMFFAQSLVSEENGLVKSSLKDLKLFQLKTLDDANGLYIFKTVQQQHQC